MPDFAFKVVNRIIVETGNVLLLILRYSPSEVQNKGCVGLRLVSQQAWNSGAVGCDRTEPRANMDWEMFIRASAENKGQHRVEIESIQTDPLD